MRYRLLIFFALIVAGCSSPKKNDLQQRYPNIKQLTPPGSQKYTPSKTYIDSVKIITYNDKNALLIAGNLPNGCTKLHKSGHALRHDSLTISLTAWKPADKNCTQALVPFQFIYDQVASSKLNRAKFVQVNQKHFDLK